ncbi:hypothetical protein [Xanthomonas medicagonis]|uniref:hypothetical protein n=1 Tax=Xanthomonas medicagonis TaxID=3160841 RepID=UPI003510EEAB
MSRAALVSNAARLAPAVDVTDHDSDADVRRRVVKAVLGSDAVAGRCDDYVEGQFDDLVETGQVALPTPLVPRLRSRLH